MCASTGQHVGVGRGVRGARRACSPRSIIPDGHVALGQARAGADPRREGRADPRQLRRRAPPRARARRARRRDGRELDQPVPHRGPEDGRVRDLRRARRRARRALHPGRQRRQHHRVLEGLRRVRRRRTRDEATAHARAGRPPGRGAARARRAGAAPRDDRHRDPDREPGELGAGDRAHATSRAARSSAVTDAQILDAYRLLAATEGVFVEPASAASVAGLLQAAAARGSIERGETSCAP